MLSGGEWEWSTGDFKNTLNKISCNLIMVLDFKFVIEGR